MADDLSRRFEFAVRIHHRSHALRDEQAVDDGNSERRAGEIRNHHSIDLMKTYVFSVLAILGQILHAQIAPDNEPWPRSYTVDGAEVIVYEPRIEKWQDSTLDARIAAGIKLKSGEEVIYGSFAAHAEALANTETRTVTLFNFSASDVKVTDAPDKLAEFTRIINALAPEKPLKVPLDKLLAAVPSDDVITKVTVTTATQTKAPKVIVRFENTVLVAFDGKPVFRSIPGAGLAAAVNTPATLLQLENSGTLYLLTNDGFWLQAAGWAGPWSPANSLPPGFERIPADHPVALAVKNAWPAAGAIVSVPEVVMSETPTELIQFDGKPKYDRVGELPLVRVSNTRSPLFFHSDQGVFYVLISGRWFVSAELTGPWTYVPHNELPAEFAQIPTDDASADVRASVAGTREAEEAVKEAQIPTYARVNVQEAPQIRVEYDGAPVFESVPGISLTYAINTTAAVIYAGGLYYCCQDGLWFVADAAFGAPWRCATVLPREIYLMPPSCPLYHTRFCEIDNFDAGHVVYRCTPGYWGTYVDSFSRVCVYGTGWTYSAYVSSNYYSGHSWTYGLGCRYVPRRGFVRECDRVAHTSWFRHTGNGSSLCRTDSERWGGRFERDHWRGSSGRTVAFSSWKGKVVTHSDDVVKSLRHREPKKNEVSKHTEIKPQVVSLGHVAASSSKQFDQDVRAGQHGEIYRHGAEGWQRRDAGKWKEPDKTHPVDPHVVDSRKSRVVKKKELPLSTSSTQGSSLEIRSPQIPKQELNLEKVRAPHEASNRDVVTRPVQPARTEDKKIIGLPKQTSHQDRVPQPINDPPVQPAKQEQKKEQPRVHFEQQAPSRVYREPMPVPVVTEHHDAPQIAPRVEPIERREVPRVVERHDTPQIAPKVERQVAPPQIQPIQRQDPQPQVRREVPQRVEQPKQNQGSSSRDTRSSRGDDKKDDKKVDKKDDNKKR